jgi:oligogalacturonide lyase
MRSAMIRICAGVTGCILSCLCITAIAADDSPKPAATEASPKAAEPAKELPTDWIDPATGHRILRLSQEPGTMSMYFHQNGYTDRGDKLFVTIAPPDQAPTGRRGGSPPKVVMATIDLTTLGKSPPKIDKLAEAAPSGSHVVGKKTRAVYYTRFENVDGVRVGKVFATNLDTHETREVGKLPVGRPGSGLGINADETLLGGSFIDLPPLPIGAGGEGRGNTAEKSATPDSGAKTADRPGEGEGGFFSGPSEDRNSQEDRMARRMAQKLPMKLFTMNIKTGEFKTFAPSTEWLNHVQFSPTDPKLMLFCHEGLWHLVDRIWTVNVDGGEPKLMHQRTMPNEIAGHEFPGFDGRTEWYDLQTPRSGEFWLASVNLQTGERLRYSIDRGNWSVHYNQSHDGKLFAGDGGGPSSVANRTPLPENKILDTPGNGQFIFLFRPQDKYETMKVGDDEVKIGKFNVEKLADLSKHDYSLEPNLTFSPDNKWIIFRSNMFGPTHVYAVEIAKAEKL